MGCSAAFRGIGIENLELVISIFPSCLCPKLLDDTNDSQYILVHEILLQLKLYHCNSLLSFFIIQQNNQKVEKKKVLIR